jgi:hypothetical protein
MMQSQKLLLIAIILGLFIVAQASNEWDENSSGSKWKAISHQYEIK